MDIKNVELSCVTHITMEDLIQEVEQCNSVEDVLIILKILKRANFNYIERDEETVFNPIYNEE
jgi:hypothetical protein